MKSKKIPFNVTYIDTHNRRIAGLLPVKALDIKDHNTGDFHAQGLYSNEIFGQVGTEARNKRHGYINLRCQVLHPKTFDELVRLKSLYKGILSGREYAVWDAELSDFVKADILDGETGYAFFMSHFAELKFKRNRSQKRALRIDLIERFRERSVIHWFLVLPAGLRDVKEDEGGRPVEEEINKVYRKIIMASNTIAENLMFKNDPILDRIRWSIQSNIQEVYNIIVTMLSGKTGFLQAKWGSRKVTHGTTNVVSSMDTGCDDLDGPRAFDNSTTLLGLYQILKAAEPKIRDHGMPNIITDELIQNITQPVELVDTKTLKPVSVMLSEKSRAKWGTEDGRGKIIDHYGEVTNRHRPIMVDGHYLRLLYRDDKGFKVLRSIEEVPDHLDKANAKPITYAEYFYIVAYAYHDEIPGFQNRYPITGIESNYPHIPYIKTTVKSFILQPYSEDWTIEAGAMQYPEFPDTANESAFMDTSAPHTSQLPNLNMDFDGDRSSTILVASKQSVAEIKEKLNTPENYLTSTGEMHQSSSNDVLDRVFRSFTGF